MISIGWDGSLSHAGFRNTARISGNVLRRYLDPSASSDEALPMEISHLLDPQAAAFRARPRRNLIGDGWQDAPDGGTTEIVGPATGRVIGHPARSASTDLDLARRAARHALEQRPRALTGSWLMPPRHATTALQGGIWRCQ